jgi:putative transposase
MGGSYDGPLSCGSAELGSIEGRYNDSGWPTPWCSKLCMIRYHSSRPADAALRGRLRNLGNERRCFGYRRLFVLLRREGKPSGINRIYRPYREEGLTVRKLAGLPQSCGDPCPDPGRGEAQRALVAGLRPRPVRQRPVLPHPSTCPPHHQGMPGCDSGDVDLGAGRVARELAAIVERRGKPGMIGSDHGTEFTCNAVLLRRKARGCHPRDHQYGCVAPDDPRVA